MSAHHTLVGSSRWRNARPSGSGFRPTAKLLAIAWGDRARIPSTCDCGTAIEWCGAWVDAGTDVAHRCVRLE